MALFELRTFSPPPLQPIKHPLLLKPQNTITLIPLYKNPRLSSSLRCPYKLLCHKTTTTNSSLDSSESSSSSISSVFIKGIPLSTTEGRLKKTFSQFGQVSQVKIFIDPNTKESLGYGYVWYTKEEFAQLAVDEMNGKFFDGRFILVKIGKPGLSSNRRRRNSSLTIKF